MKPSSPFLISLGAALATVALLLAVPGHAAGPGYYAATPVAAPAARRLVVRDIAWQCGDAGCTASAKGTSRPVIICQSLVKEIGPLASFRAGTDVFDAESLARCNARA